MHIDLGKAKGVLGGIVVILKGKRQRFPLKCFVLFEGTLSTLFCTWLEFTSFDNSRTFPLFCLNVFVLEVLFYFLEQLDCDNCKSKDHFFTQ